MSIKRTKYRVGPFEHGHIEVEPDSADSLAAAFEIVKAVSPAGCIASWRPHADRLGVAGDLLDAAGSLIDANGSVDNIDRFDALMAQAQLQIEQAQNESLDVYGLAGRKARHNEQLSQTASTRNEERRREAAAINAKLIALDDEMAAKYPKFNQEQRAKKIIKQHPGEVPNQTTPPSLAKRIRNARK